MVHKYNFQQVIHQCQSYIATFQDVFKLTSQLPNLVESYRVPWDKWNHEDYVQAIDADEILYPEILRNMENMTS